MNGQNIVILTGAGISAESGIRTFRDAGGLWEGHNIYDVATPEGFMKNPDRVHQFYNERRAALPEVQPNVAHKALVRLEQELKRRGGSFTLVTQNVDDLHERAGSQHIYHMHGQLLSGFCQICRHRWEERGDLSTETICGHCQTAGQCRPDIVWFGEMPYFMEQIEKAISRCDLFVSIGTSGAVYPAAGFVRMAGSLDKNTLEMNLDPSDGSHLFDESRLGMAGALVPAWVDEILDT